MAPTPRHHPRGLDGSTGSLTPLAVVCREPPRRIHTPLVWASPQGEVCGGKLRRRLVGQLDTIAVDDNLTAGVFRNASGGPDGLVKRVERDEDALDALDPYAPVVSVIDNVNVTVSHAREASHPLRSTNIAQTVRRYRAGRSDVR